MTGIPRHFQRRWLRRLRLGLRGFLCFSVLVSAVSGCSGHPGSELVEVPGASAYTVIDLGHGSYAVAAVDIDKGEVGLTSILPKIPAPIVTTFVAGVQDDRAVLAVAGNDGLVRYALLSAAGSRVQLMPVVSAAGVSAWNGETLVWTEAVGLEGTPARAVDPNTGEVLAERTLDFAPTQIVATPGGYLLIGWEDDQTTIEVCDSRLSQPRRASFASGRVLAADWNAHPVLIVADDGGNREEAVGDTPVFLRGAGRNAQAGAAAGSVAVWREGSLIRATADTADPAQATEQVADLAASSALGLAATANGAFAALHVDTVVFGRVGVDSTETVTLPGWSATMWL